jgi:hypothetical protein
MYTSPTVSNENLYSTHNKINYIASKCILLLLHMLLSSTGKPAHIMGEMNKEYSAFTDLHSSVLYKCITDF